MLSRKGHDEEKLAAEGGRGVAGKPLVGRVRQAHGRIRRLQALAGCRTAMVALPIGEARGTGGVPRRRLTARFSSGHVVMIVAGLRNKSPRFLH